MNLVEFSDDCTRSAATNMMWFRDTGTGIADLNEFGVPGAALLPAATVGDGANPTGAHIRALDLPIHSERARTTRDSALDS